jgi:YbbR domain-containing protein
MLQIFKHNFLLKVLSFALALAGWGYFKFANSPVTAARLAQQLSIPITTTHLAVGYLPRYAEKEAVVTVAAPKRGSAAIRPDDVKAVLDLGGLQAGVYNVPIRLVAPNVVVQSLSPASVTLTIERLEQKTFPLALYYAGSGRRFVVASDATILPAQATARGGSDDLSRIAAIRADVPLPNAPEVFDAMVRPLAVDSLGTEVFDVQVSPNLVRVRVHFAAAKR